MKEDSFYLPDFEGIANVSTISDVDVLDETLKKATECQKILSKMVSAIHRQKRFLEGITFTYELDSLVVHYVYVVSIIKIPSDPNLKLHRVSGTYTECYSSLIDAISHARSLINDFKERGISVRIGKGIITEKDMVEKEGEEK